MIGTALKKLAKQHGMTVASGVAYGSLKGYATTLSEGAGYKRIDIATKFPEVGQQEQLRMAVNTVDLQKQYRVQTLEINAKRISIVFLDNPGTMKRLEAFIDWFYPLLEQYGATGVNVCLECGGDITSGSWHLVNGVAFHFHDSCAAHLERELADGEQQRKEADTGSYVQGLIGALLGAALGAVVWALVLLMGYVASVVGLLIGWLAEKGYTLLHGKQGKGKVAILILAIVLGVVLGTLVSDGIYLGQMISKGELVGYSLADIPSMILFLLVADSEYLRTTAGNIGMGLLFAALGVFALLRKTGKEVSGNKMQKLP